MKFKYNDTSDRWEMNLISFFEPIRWEEVWAWCIQTFGHPGTDPDTGVKSDWDYHGASLYFYDEKYVTMFLLRWA